MKSRNSCPACESPKVRSRFVVNTYEISQCVFCKTLFVSNCPSQEELKAIYRQESYYDLTGESKERIVSENRRRLRIIRRFSKAGAFLDVGCAQGLLLDDAKRAGYETFGIELNAENAKVASRNGHQIACGDFGELEISFGGRRFEVIVCLDVIEHVEQPVDLLRTLVRVLDPSGTIVVSTPNYSGVVAKVLGRRDPYMTPPEHLTFFTRKGLHFLRARCGLDERYATSFGTLTEAELRKSIVKYLPWLPSRLDAFVGGGVNAAFALANSMMVGLEQEVYLRRKR